MPRRLWDTDRRPQHELMKAAIYKQFNGPITIENVVDPIAAFNAATAAAFSVIATVVLLSAADTTRDP